MTLPERIIPPLVWVLFIGEALYGGASVPHQTFPLWKTLPMPILGLFFAFGVIAALLTRSASARRSLVWKAASSVFGEAQLANIADRIRFPILAAIFFTLLGGIAWLGCVRAGSPQGNVFFSQVAISVGVGMLLGLALVHLRGVSPRTS
jgi:hypothetical protein